MAMNGTPLSYNRAYLNKLNSAKPPVALYGGVANLDEEQKRVYIQALGFSQIHKDLVQLSNQIAQQGRPSAGNTTNPPR